MNIYNNINDFSGPNATVITTGTFDGLHIGHQKIISTLLQTSVKYKLESVVLTFNPHPRIALFPEDKSIRLLSSLDEKIERFKQLGINHLIIHPFDKAFSRTSVIHYIRDILIEKLRMKHLVVGHDHHFGKNREGNLENIKELEEIYGFSTHKVEALAMDEINISSTKIRNALKAGDLLTVKKYLGYSFTFSGKVVHGDKIGRSLGFPTANIITNDPYKLIPAEGAYAVKARWNTKRFKGMMTIGKRQTLKDQEHRIEVHLFDFHHEIYGDNLHIEVVQKIRDNKKFENLDELKKALESDVIRAKNTLL